jgi:hypothetical protein
MTIRLRQILKSFEALTVFGDPMGIYTRESGHSIDEDRIS